MATKSNGASQTLRRRAEDIAKDKQQAENLLDFPVEDTARILHELRVQQIELEIQNEELRRSQKDLEVSRAHYYELYNFAPVGYLTISDKGLVTKANLAFSAMVSVTMKALIKRPFSQFVFREDQDSYYFWRKALLETAVTQVCELRLMKSDGTPNPRVRRID